MKTDKEKVKIETYPINTILYTLDTSNYKIKKYKIVEYTISCTVSSIKGSITSIVYVLKDMDSTGPKYVNIKDYIIGRTYFTSKEELIKKISN